MVIDDVITYLQNKIDSDDTLPNGIKVLEAYTYGHKVNTTEVQVQFINHAEYEKYTTFNGIEVSVCPLLITVYGAQTDFEKTVQGETVTVTMSAQRLSYVLAEKIVNWFDYATLSINNVLNATKARLIPGQPFDTGTILYQSVVRVNLHVKNI